MIEVANWKEVKTWRWPDFSPHEMSCKGDGSLKVDEKFMDTLQAVRAAVGFPMVVTSGYRSPAYNAKISETGEHGPHTTGMAVDISVSGPRAVTLLQVAMQLGMRGFGISQKGASRFIHLDMVPNSPESPRPALWSY